MCKSVDDIFGQYTSNSRCDTVSRPLSGRSSSTISKSTRENDNANIAHVLLAHNGNSVTHTKHTENDKGIKGHPDGGSILDSAGRAAFTLAALKALR